MLYIWRSGTSQLVFPSVSKRPFLLTWEIPVVQMILEIVEQGSETITISRLVLSAAYLYSVHVTTIWVKKLNQFWNISKTKRANSRSNDFGQLWGSPFLALHHEGVQCLVKCRHAHNSYLNSCFSALRSSNELCEDWTQTFVLFWVAYHPLYMYSYTVSMPCQVHFVEM